VSTVELATHAAIEAEAGRRDAQAAEAIGNAVLVAMMALANAAFLLSVSVYTDMFSVIF
jgi:hypothetical protein